jgi:heme A synthase
MDVQATASTGKFVKYAWFALGYNLLVILWGVFLRASYSGDGCGQHWLTCGGEVVPSAPQLKTIIEFSHRITTALDGFVVLILLIWAFRAFPKRHAVRLMAIASFVMIIVEALIGRGLVLTGNTAGAITPERPFWTAGHLISTFILLAVLTLTAWYAKTEKRLSLKGRGKLTLSLFGIGLLGILLVGISGSIAALGSMLFPSVTLAEGFARDFAETSNFLLRLRIAHPILSIALGVYLCCVALWAIKRSPDNFWTKRWANLLTIIVIVQLLVGGLTLVMLAPIVMQLIHLLLADLVWIIFILMSAEFLSETDGFDVSQKHEER